MFPNLNAEQAKYGETNESAAAFLGLNRNAYELRKKKGSFSIAEANKLCEKYKCSYAYLFSETPIPPNA